MFCETSEFIARNPKKIANSFEPALRAEQSLRLFHTQGGFKFDENANPEFLTEWLS